MIHEEELGKTRSNKNDYSIGSSAFSLQVLLILSSFPQNFRTIFFLLHKYLLETLTFLILKCISNYFLGKGVKTGLASRTKKHFFQMRKKQAWDGPVHCEMNLGVIKSSRQGFRAALCQSGSTNKHLSLIFHELEVIYLHSSITGDFVREIVLNLFPHKKNAN